MNELTGNLSNLGKFIRIETSRKIKYWKQNGFEQTKKKLEGKWKRRFGPIS